MPTITFRVDLNTVNELTHKPPYDIATEGSNFKNTRKAMFPDNLLDFRKLEHDDEFTVSGETALYLKNNYTSGTYAFLDIVTEVP